MHARVSITLLAAFSLTAAALAANMAQPASPTAASTVPLAVAPALMPPVDSGSTGADGAFAPTQNIQVDLGVSGTYDPARWAVIFNYSSVLIPQGVTVTFKNHPSRAPVVWLVQGNVTIAGTVNLDGQDGSNSVLSVYYAEPGPGGFRGGTNSAGTGYPAASGGFGPGGGSITSGGAAGYVTTGQSGFVYGNPTIPYLIGGSGGSARSVSDTFGGGAGGGAILIAANGTISLTSSGIISANGGTNPSTGNMGGSGGAIKMIANHVSIAGQNRIQVAGGSGASVGRIRIEKNTSSSIVTSPVASEGLPGPVWPQLGSPSVRIVSIGSTATPLDPRSGLGGAGPASDVSIPTSGNTPVVIECQNAPLNSVVLLHITGANGNTSQQTVTSVGNPLVGTSALSTITATVNLAQGVTALQARVVLP